MSLFLPILLLVLGTPILLCPSSCQAQEYYVTPTSPPNPACPSGKPCHTLSYYASNVSLFDGKENVSLFFLDGFHVLVDLTFVMNGTQSVIMSGIYRPNSTAQPRVKGTISFLFVDNAIIENLNFEMSSIMLDLPYNILIRNSHFLFTGLRTVISNLPSIPKLMEPNFAITITDCTINGGPGIDVNYALQVGTLTLRISDTLINNTSAGLEVFRSVSTISEMQYVDIKLENTELLFNNYGVEVEVSGVQTNLTLSKCTFANNQHALSLTVTERPLVASIPATLTVVNSFFDNNSGFVPTVFLHSVSVYFIGETSFFNNVGSTGGAIHMSESTIWLDEGANLTFANNTARIVGGAIYIETRQQNLIEILLNDLPSVVPECFYQLTFELDSKYTSVPVSMHFFNNSAPDGGDNIYGVSLKDRCTVTRYGDVNSGKIQDKIFEFHSLTLSPVSSIQKRVCMCENGIPQCNKVAFKDVYVTSGEQFSLSLVLVGDDFGTATGGVFAIEQNQSISDFTFGPRQTLQIINSSKECTDLEYSVHSTSDNVKFLLSRDSITASTQRDYIGNFSGNSIASAVDDYNRSGVISVMLQYAPMTVTVNLVPCPLGFILIGENPVCHCEDVLRQYVTECTISNQTGILYRNGTTWISSTVIDTNSNTTDGILVNNVCPFHYCRTENIPVRLDQPDVQCAFNHTGILCGGCPSNLSLALGSSQCLPCSNDGHIALFLVFAVAGVALVFFIKIFDLTVARGTINGLIFYANVIWINQSIFFPSGNEQTTQSLVKFLRVIKVFIAWINLDFGIETCFLDGLDAYWKTWLQFVFPIYLWILSALIILVCRYSTRATKFFGNNAVSVLATLFLLSYVKLLRTIVSVLGFAILQQYHPEGTKAVWLLDGNVPYLGLYHAFLFLAAVLTLILLWLPYTTILLFVPLMNRSTKKSVFFWVAKFKPLFDTYIGPLKHKYQYWIGLTLLVRVFFAIIAVAVQAINPIINVNLLVIISSLLSIFAAHVYKKKYVFLLEVWFIFNLLVVGSAFLATDVIETRIICICVSVVISFMTFLGIIVFHVYSSLKKYIFRQKQPAPKSKLTRRNGTRRKSRKGSTKNRLSQNFTTHTVVELRESLLETVNIQ